MPDGRTYRTAIQSLVCTVGYSVYVHSVVFLPPSEHEDVLQSRPVVDQHSPITKEREERLYEISMSFSVLNGY